MVELTESEKATLMANTWFAGLHEEVRAEILARARRLELGTEAPLFLRGDSGNGWFVLLSGSVRIGGTTSEGRQSLLTFMTPGHWVGEMSLIDGGPRTHDAHAQAPCRLLQVVPGDFKQLLERHPSLTLALLQRRCGATRALMSLIETTTTAPLETQLAARIVALHRSIGAPETRGDSPGLHLSQEQLAQLLGVSRPRINQVLKHWERAGLVQQHYGRLVILDPLSLRALAEEGAGELLSGPSGNPMADHSWSGSA